MTPDIHSLLEAVARVDETCAHQLREHITTLERDKADLERQVGYWVAETDDRDRQIRDLATRLDRLHSQLAQTADAVHRASPAGTKRPASTQPFDWDDWRD